MPTTTLFDLRYPADTEAVDVPTDMGELADDVDSWLCRAFPCLSTARPSSPPDGFIIRETDTGDVRMWDGLAWVTFGGSGGGGGSIVNGHAQYTGTAQTVPNATDTTCAFPQADVASPLVARSIRGAGHAFTLQQTGLWAISTTIRYATTSATGERYAGIHQGSGGGTPMAGAGSAPTANNPATLAPALVRFFSSGSVLFVNLYQGTGGTRTLEPSSSGGWVRINLSLIRE